MMRSERPSAAPSEAPKRRGGRKKKESPVEMEGLTDASELRNAAANDASERATDMAVRGAETAEALTRKMEQMAEQKEVNLKNPALSESMTKKINAEIDRNIEELSRKRDELEGVTTSAAPIEKVAPKSRKERPATKLGPRKAGEAPRTYEEHRADLDKAFDDIERRMGGERDTLVDAELPAKMAAAAEEHEAEDVDLTELNAEAAEDAFFARGEKMTAAHEAGETIAKNEAEMAGERGERRHLMAERAELLRAEIPGLQNAVTAAERRLHREYGVENPDAVLQARADSAWESAKGFLGGLFSKKEKMKNAALEDYRRLRDRLSSRQSDLNEAENRLHRPEEVQKAFKLKGERNRPETR